VVAAVVAVVAVVVLVGATELLVAGEGVAGAAASGLTADEATARFVGARGGAAAQAVKAIKTKERTK